MDRCDTRSLRTDFLSHADRHPDDVAVEVGGASIRYGELSRTARAWAACMVAAKGGRLDRVGVFAYRSPTAYTGVLAALCGGATFVPLNPTFPVARTRQMLRRAAQHLTGARDRERGIQRDERRAAAERGEDAGVRGGAAVGEHAHSIEPPPFRGDHAGRPCARRA